MSKKITPRLKVSRKKKLAELEDSLVEIFPYGISASTSEGRPVFIFKDGKNEAALPIWLSPLSGATIVAGQQGEEPHALSQAAFSELKLKVPYCVIDEIVGHRQYARVFITGQPEVQMIRVRADAAISFGLAFKTRFYTTRDFIVRCREVDAELIRLEHGLSIHPEIGSKNHPYVM